MLIDILSKVFKNDLKNTSLMLRIKHKNKEHVSLDMLIVKMYFKMVAYRKRFSFGSLLRNEYFILQINEKEMTSYSN